MKKILTIGKGRIGQAIHYYLKKYSANFGCSFFSEKTNIKNYSLLINALPGELGEKGLKLALKYKKDLIDVADVDYSFYLKNKKNIEKKGILVFPGCGFSPGLVNLISGRETKENKVKEIEISAGTFSPKKFFYPFLWCFGDLIEGHKLKATLIKKRKKIQTEPFSDYRKEIIDGIKAESYLAEGLDSLTRNLKIKDMSYRVLRPLGFYNFFKYLENHNFFKKENLNFTKKLLEKEKRDNITLGRIKIKTKNRNIIWKIKSFSKKNEKLNSMQKITAVYPTALAKILLKGEFPYKKGLFFSEKIGEDEKLFKQILKETQKIIYINKG